MAKMFDLKFKHYLNAIRSEGGGRTEARFPILFALALYANQRNRAWPDPETLAADTGYGYARVIDALQWLADRGAIYNVPADKRSGAEKKVRANKHIYQLTGLIRINGQTVPYQYMLEEEQQHMLEEIVTLGGEEIVALLKSPPNSREIGTEIEPIRPSEIGTEIEPIIAKKGAKKGRIGTIKNDLPLYEVNKDKKIKEEVFAADAAGADLEMENKSLLEDSATAPIANEGNKGLLAISEKKSGTREESQTTVNRANSPITPPIAPPPPLPIFGRQPISDAEFATLKKTDQRTAIFSVICWRSYGTDPSISPRGGIEDSILKALLTAYPTLTPNELNNAYDAYSVANEGSAMLRAKEKLVKMVDEFRQKGRIDSPIKRDSKGGGQAQQRTQAGFHNRFDAPNFESLLAMKNPSEMATFYHQDAIKNMQAPRMSYSGDWPEFIWYLLKKIAHIKKASTNVDFIQQCWNVYQGEATRVVSLEEVLQGDGKRNLFISQVKKLGLSARLTAALMADVQARQTYVVSFGTIQEKYKEEQHGQQ